MASLLLALPLLMQTPEKGAINGTVVAADTGAPIVGVQVTARSDTPEFAVSSATTDAQGRFSISDLTPGRAYVILIGNAADQGYARQAYGSPLPGARGWAGAVPVSVAPGETVDGIDVRLTRGASISGRILGSRGEPFVDAEVRIHRVRYDESGTRGLIGEGPPVAVNDRGEFRLFGLDPGTVYLSAGPQLRIIVMEPGGGASRYAEKTLHPRAATYATASLIDLKAGADLTNIDIQLLPRPTVHNVRGRLLDARTGQAPPNNNVEFSLVPLDKDVGNLRGYRPESGADGSFEIKDVEAGQYWISARLRAPLARPQPGEQPVFPAGLIAFQRIDLRNADVAGIVLTFAPPLEVSGNVKLDGQPISTLPEGDRVRVLLDVVRNGAFPMNMATPLLRPVGIGADGTFAFADVPPGEYRVKLSGLPDEFYAKDARLGGVDALNEPVTISNATPFRLDIVLARASGQLTGQLLDAQQQPVADAQVVLVPDKLRQRADLYKTATSDRMGRFSIRGIAPGDYKAFAWKTIEPFRYFDSDFVTKFEDRGEPVHIDTAPVTVTVHQIP